MAKQNIQSVRNARYERNGTNPDGTGKSKYSKKVREGKQMYGPGCCAHSVRVRGDQQAA